MKKVLFSCMCLAYVGLSSLIAQSLDTSKLKNRPFQLTFVYPMGTNGLESGNYTNNVSFNWFAGYNGGTNGLELGGFANIDKKNMQGIQIAGFCNTVLGKTEGCQISGFSNYSGKSTIGTQISGFSNIVKDSAIALQISGFSNVVFGTTTGSQFAGYSNFSRKTLVGSQISGFSNVVLDTTKGLQISGFSNFAKGMTTGCQITGFSNVSLDSTQGTQLSGFVNVSTKGIIGAQISGFANVAIGETNGVQISGFSNITTKDLDGAQVSGFINIAGKIKGTQIGFFNYCDSVEQGIPIGFLSIVKHGYHAIELHTNESLFLEGSLHLGVPQFYNIFSFGGKINGDNFLWGSSYGVGTMLSISDKIALNLELESGEIHIDTWDYESFNSMNKAHIKASYKLANNIALYGGLSYNVFVTNTKDEAGNFTDSGIVPWATYSKSNQYNLVKMFPGFSVGITYEL